MGFLSKIIFPVVCRRSIEHTTILTTSSMIRPWNHQERYMSKISRVSITLKRKGPNALKYCAGLSFWGIRVPMMDRAARESSTTTVRRMEAKKLHRLAR